MDNAQIGQAGEYLAAAVLQREFPAIAFPDRPSAYDLLIETEVNTFLRCQVKTSDVINSVNGCDYWKFNIRRTAGNYKSGDCDFFAFVVLRARTVVFAKSDDVTTSFRVRLDDATFENEERTLKQTLGEWL